MALQTDEESSEVCWFSTPYQCLRLPFEPNVSANTFFKKVLEVFEGTPNMRIYFNDLVVFGKTKAHHDTALRQVIKVALKYKKFNIKKYHTQQIRYVGYLFAANHKALRPKYKRS